MIKKLIVSFATLGLILHATGCTSKKVEGEPDATAEMAADDSGEFADSGEEAGSSDFSEDDFGSDEAVAESAPAEGGDAMAGDAADVSGDVAAATEGFDESFGDEAPPADGGDNLAAGGSESSDVDAMGTPSDFGSTETAMNDSGSSLGGDEMGGLSEEPPAPKPVVPLKKIQTTPWTQSGVLLNAVYIARPGDTFETVSQKIYGSDDKVRELKKVNPVIAARKMKVGDKIYYNSPRRPDDSTQLLTFYEDMGLNPELYVSVPGDNIRDVSQRLLGDPNSWKEIWATNLEVDSKGELPEGTRLKYWAGEVVAQAPLPPPMEEAPPQMNDMAANIPPEPPMEAAPPMPEEAPPVPPTTAEVAPPVPPPMDQAPPPPPVVAEAPPAPSQVPAMGDVGSGDPLNDLMGGDDQTTALMIGAILLIAAVALFIMIRKRKARRNIDFQTATHTQIE